MTSFSPFYRRGRFWRIAIPVFLILLFVFMFRKELLLAFSWIYNFLRIVVFSQPVFLLLNSDIRAFVLQNAAFFWTQETRQAFAILAVNCFIGFFTFGAMIIWMAQFTLPVRQMNERFKAANRLLLYLLHMHGPAIFVNEGKIVSNQKEMKRHLPGVALVDLSSALVLEKSFPFQGRVSDPYSDDELDEKPKPSGLFTSPKTKWPELGIKAVGPGLLFTEGKEKVHGAVDLRRQFRSISAPKIDAYTRDGIKVESTIYSLFSLSDDPETIPVTYIGEKELENLRAVIVDKIKKYGDDQEDTYLVDGVISLCELDLADAAEIHKNFVAYDIEFERRQAANNTSAEPRRQYPFDDDRVIKASYYRPRTPGDQNEVDWTELPNMVAVKEFRNTIAKYSFDYLYMPDNPEIFPLQRIKQEFAFKVKSKGIMKYQIVSRLDGKTIEIDDEWNQNEYAYLSPRILTNSQVIRDRGIRVVAAGFGELQPVRKEVRDELIDNWTARWQKEINTTLAQRDLEAARVRNRARVQVQSSSPLLLSDIIVDNGKFTEEALTVRVFQALESAATDLTKSRLLPHDTINMLWSLYQWMIRDEDKDNNGSQSLEDEIPSGSNE